MRASSETGLNCQIIVRESAGWYNTQALIDEGADQSALMNSLVLLFVVCIDDDRFP